MGDLAPFNEDAITPRLVLLAALDQADDMEAVMVVSIDKAGTHRASWSGPTESHLALLLVKFQAYVVDLFRD